MKAILYLLCFVRHFSVPLLSQERKTETIREYDNKFVVQSGHI